MKTLYKIFLIAIVLTSCSEQMKTEQINNLVLTDNGLIANLNLGDNFNTVKEKLTKIGYTFNEKSGVFERKWNDSYFDYVEIYAGIKNDKLKEINLSVSGKGSNNSLVVRKLSHKIFDRVNTKKEFKPLSKDSWIYKNGNESYIAKYTLISNAEDGIFDKDSKPLEKFNFSVKKLNLPSSQEIVNIIIGDKGLINAKAGQTYDEFFNAIDTTVYDYIKISSPKIREPRSNSKREIKFTKEYNKSIEGKINFNLIKRWNSSSENNISFSLNANGKFKDSTFEKLEIYLSGSLRDEDILSISGKIEDYFESKEGEEILNNDKYNLSNYSKKDVLLIKQYDETLVTLKKMRNNHYFDLLINDINEAYWIPRKRR